MESSLVEGDPMPVSDDELSSEAAAPPSVDPAPTGASRFWGILRFVVGFGVAGILIRMVIVNGGADLKEEWRHCEGAYLTLSFFMVGCGIALSSYRWSRLLDVQDVHLSGHDAIRLSMIGQFFNLAIPGGVGGDIIKMLYLKRQAGTHYPEAIMTTLFDRILGLMGLFMVAIISVIVSWNFLMQAPPKIQYTVMFVGLISLAGAVGVTTAMYHEVFFRFGFVLALMARAKAACPAKVWSIARRVVRSVSLFRVHLNEVIIALLISMSIHTLGALSVWSIGQAFHAPKLRMQDYFISTQVANTISAVPITPGGLGGRDYILNAFFQAFGEGAKASVIPVVGSLLMVLWSLVASLFFLFERAHLNVPLHSTAPQP